MLKPAVQITPETAAHATYRARHRTEEFLEKARRATADSERADRLKAQLCVCCFYIAYPRIGGAALTTQPCGACQKPQVYASTATDVLCVECARSHELCKRCGADIELRKDGPFLSES